MIYLLHHGEAFAKETDPTRPLTDAGAEHVDNIGIFLARGEVAVSTIFHSGKLRAEQSADILAEHLTPDRPPEAMDDIGPTDPTENIASDLHEWSDGVTLVSHMPFVGRLAGRLVLGDEHRPPVAFVPGTVAAFERAGDDAWVVAWMIRPELVQQ
jgi:phosphohistidine phosphatase